MNRLSSIAILCVACFALFFVGSCASVHRSASQGLKWNQLPSIPDAVGFAGSFAGVSHGALVVAGGANIENKWTTNFHKIWYDSVFVLENPTSQWRLAGKLPHPLGYGVSIAADDGLICIGGSDATAHYADVFKLSWTNGLIRVASLPQLPKPCANFCGAKIGRTIYVAGGLESPAATKAMKTFWALDLSAKEMKWVELPPWPGPERMLAVAGVLHGEFYLISGTKLKFDAQGKTVREYLTDAYAFSPDNGWRKIPDVPRSVTAAPSPALSTEKLLVISGDDGANIDVPPSPAHPGFSRNVFGYDPQLNQWAVVGSSPFSRATAPVVEWNGHVVVPMGEVRPRERTSEVWWTQLPQFSGKDSTP